MARHNILTTAALALAGTLCFQTGAKADTLSDFFRDFVGIAPTQYRVNVHESITLSNLDLQRSQLHARISAALANGEISPAEAANLRAQISMNENLQAQMMADGHLNFVEAQQLVSALGNLDSHLQTAFTTYSAVVPRGLGSNFRALGQINALQARLQTRLEMGRASGRLTSSEYFALKAELDRIAMREARMRARGGFINRFEHDRLLSQLRSLQFRMQTDLRDSQFAGRNRFWY